MLDQRRRLHDVVPGKTLASGKTGCKLLLHTVLDLRGGLRR
jgi:hypothetical protein